MGYFSENSVKIIPHDGSYARLFPMTNLSGVIQIYKYISIVIILV